MNRLSTFLAVALLLVVGISGCVSPPKQPISVQSLSLGAAEQPSANGRTPASIENQVEALIAQLTLEEKISMVHGNTKFSVAGLERFGIPQMNLSDGPHGVREQLLDHQWGSANRDDDFATYLPTLISLAATWDPAMATLHGSVLGSEARHRNKDIILGPGVNIMRLPLNGRNFEYLGEDPFLASRMAVPQIKAIQANDVSASVKHFALNNQELNRKKHDSRPDERTLREIYLPAFEAAVKEGGVWSVMGAYNSVYGTNSSQNRQLVTDILKNEWGFKGILMTDWEVNINTYDAAMNGLDLEMGTNADYSDYFMSQPLLKMIRSGKVPEAVLDEKVRRMLRVRLNIGMMNPDRLPGERETIEHRKAAQLIAENSIVLLKNSDHLLPLDKSKLKKVIVMGPNASITHARAGGSSQVKTRYEVTPLEGLKKALGDKVDISVIKENMDGALAPIAPEFIASRQRKSTASWEVLSYQTAQRSDEPKNTRWPLSSYRWPSNSEQQFITLKGQLQPIDTGLHRFKLEFNGNARLWVDGKEILKGSHSENSILTYSINLEAGRIYPVVLEYDGNKNLTLGWDSPSLKYLDKKDYLSAAKQADAVFYFGGLDHDQDVEDKDRVDMKLPGNQDRVIAELVDVNPNTVVLLVAGSPVEMPWVEGTRALIWGGYAGMHAGDAFARVIFGEVNPSGKLPFTLPATLSDSAPIALDDYNAEQALYKEGVFVGYRWFEKNNIKPNFAFGHGLSYSTFALSDLRIPAVFDNANGKITVAVTIKNTGKVAGAEVVQLYLGDEQASVPRPVRELKGFQKVSLQPGEVKTLNFDLQLRDLSFWDVNTHNWLAEAGVFNVYLGASSDDIRLQGQFNYQPVNYQP